jgi:hypothetical protein
MKVETTSGHVSPHTMNNRARKQPNASMLVSCHGLVVTSDRSREEGLICLCGVVF